jgi:16S rRNA (guanine527-N7)-methyltransferase
MNRTYLIKQTLEHFQIPAQSHAVDCLAGFIDELDRWNKKINLVGLKDMDEVCRELLADAFHLNLFLRDRKRIADIGSGSGILGFPLAVLNKSMDVVSVDSNLKKIQFQRHISRTMGPANFMPVHGRVELIDPVGADGLICKAFGTIESMFLAAERHLLPGGLIFMPKGRTEDAVENERYVLERSLLYSLPGVEKEYRLLVYKKIP